MQAKPVVLEDDSLGLHYYFFQYFGLVVASIACIGTAVFYDQDDPYMVAKVLAWTGLAFLGLMFHEFRPGKVE